MVIKGSPEQVPVRVSEGFILTNYEKSCANLCTDNCIYAMGTFVFVHVHCNNFKKNKHFFYVIKDKNENFKKKYEYTCRFLVLLFLLTLSLLLLSLVLIVAEQDKSKTPLSNHGLCFFVLSWNREIKRECDKEKARE